ncbi:MAG: F0F1 ATP synthase subunit B [Bacteroidota bacterium]|nr:F0F1 ATP synthase subunit B [Bacteroidota bacterium]
MEKLINEFSSGLFFWQLILFVGLIFLLRKFAWKPILDAVNEREKTIIDSLNSAKEAQKEMESLQTKNKKILQEARVESDAMLIQSKQSGKEIIDQAKADAKVEAEKIIVQAKQSIDNEKRAAMNEIKNQVANLSVDIASKVIDKEMEKNNNHEDYINKLLDDQSKN